MLLGVTSAPTAASPTPASVTTPGVPTKLLASSSSGAAIVTWAAPTSDGGAPITSYRISVFAPGGYPAVLVTGGLVRTVAAPATSFTFGGLNVLRTYVFRVAAVNEVGAGPDTALSNPVAPYRQNPPTGVKAVPRPTLVATGSLFVWFTPAADNGTEPTSSYTATCTDGTYLGTRSVTALKSPIAVGNLATGSTFGCTVRANNPRAGAESVISRNVTVGAPSAPTGITIVEAPTATSTAAITVSFTPGADNGSPITSFRAICASRNGGTASWRNRATGPITVVNLTAGKSYWCNVSATNVRGTSLVSAFSRTITVGVPG